MADQAQRENNRLFGDLVTKNRIYQEHHARNCQEIVEMRRLCCKPADGVTQFRIDALSMQKKNPSTVNRLLSQIQELQDKVNSLNEEKEVYDHETASTSGMSHVLSQPSRIPSPRGMIRRDSGLPHNTRNSMGTSGNVFEDLPAPEGPSPFVPQDPKEFDIISSRNEIR